VRRAEQHSIGLIGFDSASGPHERDLCRLKVAGRHFSDLTTLVQL